MSRDVDVSRIINVSGPPDAPAAPASTPAPAPSNGHGKSGNGNGVEVDDQAQRPLAVWTAAFGAQGAVGVRRARPLTEIEHVTLSAPLDPRLVLLSEPASARARSYRLLRHRLLAQADPRVIAVTSACPGEGKTTCALNLALAMAEDTMTRVLLVDANLRRPALGQVLGCTPSTSVIANISRSTDVGPPYPVASISGTRLHVAALPVTPVEGARLDRTLFAVLLGDLSEAYDYIVIDAAAVLESGDVDVVGECSSGVIIAARAGHSRQSELRRALAQLAPARVLGSVLIDA
jgi:Mrp family chromosome partitioning ATPase